MSFGGAQRKRRHGRYQAIIKRRATSGNSIIVSDGISSGDVWRIDVASSSAKHQAEKHQLSKRRHHQNNAYRSAENVKINMRIAARSRSAARICSAA